jgi:serine acetyltransferase
MLHRDEIPDTLRTRWRRGRLNLAGDAVRWAWDRAQDVGAIGPTSRRAKAFGYFGDGSVICFPSETIVNPYAIRLGRGTVIAPYVALSAGWGPGQVDLPDGLVTIGDRCLIGRGSSIIGHASIVIGDDVWTGKDVHMTDLNHGYEDLDLPIGRQHQPAGPITIGSGSWLGHGSSVLPGVTIGSHCVIGAGSVVTSDIPDNSVAVGVPARVIRHFEAGEGWIPTAPVLRLATAEG